MHEPQPSSRMQRTALNACEQKRLPRPPPTDPLCRNPTSLGVAPGERCGPSERADFCENRCNRCRELREDAESASSRPPGGGLGGWSRSGGREGMAEGEPRPAWSREACAPGCAFRSEARARHDGASRARASSPGQRWPHPGQIGQVRPKLGRHRLSVDQRGARSDPPSAPSAGVRLALGVDFGQIWPGSGRN